MIAVIRYFLFVLALASSATYASPTVQVRQIGDYIGDRGGLYSRIEIIQAGGMAIVHDVGGAIESYDQQPAIRHQLITSDGKVSTFKNEIAGSNSNNKYIWNHTENKLYVLGSGGGSFLSKLNLEQREFVPLLGQPLVLRDAEYVPRWGTLVAGGLRGLYLVKDDNLTRIVTYGPELKDVVKIEDLPKYNALFLETIDKQLFILTSDYVLHYLGQLPWKPDTTAAIAELKKVSAVQILSVKSAIHVNMSKGTDNVWRPASFKWYKIDQSYGQDGFVAQLDAMVVKSSSMFDWLFNRSGLYRLSGIGLSPVGTWKQRASQYWRLENMPAAGISLYRQSGSAFDDQTPFRLDGYGDLTPEHRLAPLGLRDFYVSQIDGANQVIATTSMGAWLWDGQHAPVRLNNSPSSYGISLPLTKEVLLRSNEKTILVDRFGRVSLLPAYEGGGTRVLQTGEDSWIELGSKQILEVKVTRP
jgi:hypothetical protein